MTKKKAPAKDRNAQIYDTLIVFLKKTETDVRFSKPFEHEEVESLF